MKTAAHNDIKAFAQNILGCGCVEDVFKTILFNRTFTVPEISSSLKRIDIGNRLLIYVYDDKDGKALNDLQKLAKHGLNDRNTNGFNRFRLVVLRGIKTAQVNELNRAFSRIAGSDEKMHLHVLDDTAELAFLRD